MTPLKKGIFIIAGVAVVAIIVVAISKRYRKTDNTPQGFSSLLQKGQKNHPQVYAWWEALPLEKQMAIENSMNQESMIFLGKELSKVKLSDEARQLLAKAGYAG